MPVVLYTSPTCPYCIRAKKLLENKGVPYTNININEITANEREQLSVKTDGYRTVPQIFIGDTFIGGYDQLNALNQSSKLDEMLGST